uniref:Uncharacterized protein n=1 Tax=Triticum urartu TaxID=4572 RepID=A0A8R7PLJ3_TRIUA
MSRPWSRRLCLYIRDCFSLIAVTFCQLFPIPVVITMSFHFGQ